MDINRLREVFTEENGVLRYAISIGPRRAGDLAGRPHNKGYWKVGLDGKTLQAHRIIFALHHGYMPDRIDHINGIKNDNRVENLREASDSQNHWNTGLQSNNKSGVKGVCWNKEIGRWVAYCNIHRKQHYLGTFDDLEEAKKAVVAFRELHHGAFANHGTTRRAA